MSVDPRYRLVDVCAGAGGLGLGFHRAGWRGTGVEIDADACATHSANVGPCVLADVATAPAPHVADLVAGGVPCQPFSVNGDQHRLEDPRGQLFLSLLRIAVEASAKCVLMENVGGLVTGGALAVVLSAFASHGFDPAHAMLCAADYGVPQDRNRLVIVGFRDAADRSRFRWPAPTHGAPRNLYGLPAWESIRGALRLPPDIGIQWKDCGPNSEQSRVRARGLDEPSYCITANGTRSPGGMRIVWGVDASSPRAWKDAASVVRAGGDESVRLDAGAMARLQSFPDDFAFAGGVVSQRKQAGNAVPPLLAEHLAHAIGRALYSHEAAS